MSGEFLAALDPTSFKATLSRDKQTYTCACGLSIGISVDKIDPGEAGPVLAAAHALHHAKHFGVPATLHMTGESTPPGNNAIVKAQCSCDYKKEHPDA